MGNKEYQSFQEVKDDILLMLQNCETYNAPKSSLYLLAKRLRKVADRFTAE